MGIFGRSRDDQSAQDQVDLDHLKDRVAKLEAAVASLQGQVAALTGGAVAAGGQVPYAGNPAAADTDWMAEARRLKESGDAIEAIKLYREHTGLGLKEAKDAVDAMI